MKLGSDWFHVFPMRRVHRSISMNVMDVKNIIELQRISDLCVKMSRREILESMEGVEMTGPAKDTPPLSDQEKRILEVYDKLEELQFEIALLKAHGIISEGRMLSTNLLLPTCIHFLIIFRASRRSYR